MTDTIIHLAMRESLTVVRVQPSAGTVERASHQCMVVPPPYVTRLLCLQSDAPMTERATLLTVNGDPVLTSISHLPTTLVQHADAEDEHWRAAELGHLALTGHTVTVADVQHWTRPPTPTERRTLAITDDTPIAMLNQLCQIETGDHIALAAVTLIARADRVTTHWDAPLAFTHHHGHNATAAAHLP